MFNLQSKNSVRRRSSLYICFGLACSKSLDSAGGNHFEGLNPHCNGILICEINCPLSYILEEDYLFAGWLDTCIIGRPCHCHSASSDDECKAKEITLALRLLEQPSIVQSERAAKSMLADRSAIQVEIRLEQYMRSPHRSRVRRVGIHAPPILCTHNSLAELHLAFKLLGLA
jgi:hypothetical protein